MKSCVLQITCTLSKLDISDDLNFPTTDVHQIWPHRIDPYLIEDFRLQFSKYFSFRDHFVAKTQKLKASNRYITQTRLQPWRHCRETLLAARCSPRARDFMEFPTSTRGHSTQHNVYLPITLANATCRCCNTRLFGFSCL